METDVNHLGILNKIIAVPPFICLLFLLSVSLTFTLSDFFFKKINVIRHLFIVSFYPQSKVLLQFLFLILIPSPFHNG